MAKGGRPARGARTYKTITHGTGAKKAKGHKKAARHKSSARRAVTAGRRAGR